MKLIDVVNISTAAETFIATAIEDLSGSDFDWTEDEAEPTGAIDAESEVNAGRVVAALVDHLADIDLDMEEIGTITGHWSRGNALHRLISENLGVFLYYAIAGHDTWTKEFGPALGAMREKIHAPGIIGAEFFTDADGTAHIEFYSRLLEFVEKQDRV